MNKLLVTVVSWTAGTALGLLLFKKVYSKSAPVGPPAPNEGQ
jgi:hypothetical protein